MVFNHGYFVISNLIRLHSTGNFSAAEAPGTDVDMTVCTVNNGLNPLYIGLPGAIGAPVGMAHLNTKRYTLAAKFTLCHLLHLLALNSRAYL